jgi:predicted enzyme related to lactoylglutathione lyase
MRAAALVSRTDGMDMKLELVPVPVTDVDRAKAFYVDQVVSKFDHDHQVPSRRSHQMRLGPG